MLDRFHIGIVATLVRPVAALVAFALLTCTPPAQRLSPGDFSTRRPGATSVVIVHSRSGNTASVARVIAAQLGADYIRLEVPEGSGDHFMNAPNRHSTVKVTPERIDLSPYNLLFLGSPIWYWNPTAFVFQFIRNNDLSGRKVVLFYTNEGGISGGAIAEWKNLAESKGGQVIDVFGINRKGLDAAAVESSTVRIVAERRQDWEAGRVRP